MWSSIKPSMLANRMFALFLLTYSENFVKTSFNKVFSPGSSVVERLRYKQVVGGSSPSRDIYLEEFISAPLAQWLEHPTHNRLVAGSSPVGSIASVAQKDRASVS